MRKSAPKAAMKIAIKHLQRKSLKDFKIPIDSWEQAAHGRSNWHSLINTGAAHYKKRICKVEGKCK